MFALSKRKFIPPNFAELRHVVNIAQIHASAATLRLITFDADGTLYADGCHFEQVRRAARPQGPFRTRRRSRQAVQSATCAQCAHL